MTPAQNKYYFEKTPSSTTPPAAAAHGLPYPHALQIERINGRFLASEE
jgi:hypothetical protein